MIALELQKLSLGYNGKAIIKDVDFTVTPGELVGLIGPNGCGKSTIIKAMSRILTPLSGKILVDGKDITKLSRSSLARLIGVVPQMPLLPSTFTAFEIVLMGRNPHLGLLQYERDTDLKITWRAMEKTMTHSLAQRRIGELSGGEIQRIVIARVLAQEPKSILLDEPTANLDISHQVEVLNLIRSLCQERKLSVLIALHDLNLAAQFCDRLVLLNNGGVHAQGTPREVIISQNIKEVYGTDGCVFTHPINRLPTVLLTNAHNHVPVKNGSEERK